jgi:copper chaperone
VPEATSTVTLSIEGMHCGSCALLIDDALTDLPGVLTSSTSSKDRRSTVAHDERTDRARIIGAIEALGYRAAPATG